MVKFTVGVLTISDSCSRNRAVDKSGPALIDTLRKGVLKDSTVIRTGLVPDSVEDIQKILEEWAEEGVNLILTTGGTGVARTDVTPEATAGVLDITIPGISQMMFQKSVAVTPLAALSRSVAGVKKKSLIVNLPGSEKASRECLMAIADVIPHAIHLITEKKEHIKEVHASLGKKKSSVEKRRPACRDRISPYPCISVESAQKIILERIFLLREHIALNFEDALGYVLAKDVASFEDLPPFEASLKDGYAVLSSDKTNSRLVLGNFKAGDSPSTIKIPSGSCVRINTGAPLPPGTDAVVEVEKTKVQSTNDDGEETKISLEKLPSKLEDVRERGADFKMGELLLTAGTLLDAPAIGLLAAAGITSVDVFKKPVVAVISTGDELLEPRDRLTPGKVRDSNRITLLSLLKQEHFQAVDMGIVKDEPDDMRDVLERAFEIADVVVTTGSMSMGDRDCLKSVLVSDFNANILFGRVFMKPGKPTCFAITTFNGKMKFVFGLPGNPASAFVTSHLFVLPALKKISGFQDVYPRSIFTTVRNPVPLEDRPHYVRGVLKLTEDLTYCWAEVTGNQRSSRIGSCGGANCLLLFPEMGNTGNPTALNSYQCKTQLSPSSSGAFGSNSSGAFGSNSSGAFGSNTSGAFCFGQSFPTGTKIFPNQLLTKPEPPNEKERVRAFIIGKL